ncbi:MAG: phage holin family protein [Bacilli bacterium]|jgi:putative membrane protein|nr:phage holin family protein [Bacilli bacterium]
MKLMILDKTTNKIRMNRFLDWLIYMIAYSIVLLTVCLLFRKTIIIDEHYFGLWFFIATVIIYILNKTIKPVLIWLTIPLTGMTLGLFYPFINVFILNIVDFILGNHFELHGLFMSFIVAVLISIMNAIMDTIVVEPLLRRSKK